MKEYPTVEVYTMDVSKREMVEINFGGRIESLSREKAMGLADAIIHALVTDEQSYQNAMGIGYEEMKRAIIGSVRDGVYINQNYWWEELKRIAMVFEKDGNTP